MPSKRASRVGVTSFCNDILGTGYEAYGGIPGVIGGPKGMKNLDWGFEFGHAGVWLFDFTWTGTALISSSFLLQYLWHSIHCTSMYLFASSVLPFPLFHLPSLPSSPSSTSSHAKHLKQFLNPRFRPRPPPSSLLPPFQHSKSPYNNNSFNIINPPHQPLTNPPLITPSLHHSLFLPDPS
jgi:hypothetical protein